MTAFQHINDPQLDAGIDTLNPIAVRLAPQVFGTTAPFFDGMQTKIFAETRFTPKIVPYSFDDELLTRLIWGFHAHLDTQSTLTWTLIPRPLGHSFHGHLDTDSTSTWTVMFH